MLGNHFKSKGDASPADPKGERRRKRQGRRVAAVYKGLRAKGIEYVAVTGDLTDHPRGGSLKPVVRLA